MKLIVGLFAFIFMLQAHADDAASQSETQGQGICQGCLEAKGQQQVFQLRDLRGVFNDTFLPATVAKIGRTTKFPNGDTAWNKECSGFATEKGYGPYGKFMFDDLSPQRHPYWFKGTEDMIKACPNYENLSVESRKAILILIFGVASNMEASCNKDAENPNAKDGVAYGLMQLWDGHETSSAGDCAIGDAHDALKSLHCSASKMDVQLSTEHVLLTRDSHYGVFFPNEKGNTILTAMSRFPGCR